MERGFFLVAAELGQDAVEVGKFLLAQKVLEGQVGLGGTGVGRGSGSRGSAGGCEGGKLRRGRAAGGGEFGDVRRAGGVLGGVIAGGDERGREIADLDDVVLAQGGGTFDGVFEFADVAGPFMGGEELQGLAGESEWAGRCGD